MDPVSIATIGLGTSVGGGVASFLGASEKGKAEAAMYNYQAGVALVNQQIAKQNADYAIKVGETQAQQSGMEARYKVGETKAQQGAGGLDINSGSNRAVRESMEDVGEYNQAVIRSDAAKRAYGYEVEATQQGAQAGLYKMAATNARRAGDISAIGSILGTASSVSSKFLGAQQAGIF